MQRFNLCLVILLCSFVILFPSEETNQTDNIPNNKNDESKNTNDNENNETWTKLIDFLESNLFLVISNITTLIVAGILGFYLKRFHIRYTQFIQRFDKTKELFSNITAQIINDPGEEYLYISKNKIKTDTEILTVCSYLSKRKSKKLIGLYEKYKNQADGKSFNGETIEKILCFH